MSRSPAFQSPSVQSAGDRLIVCEPDWQWFFKILKKKKQREAAAARFASHQRVAGGSTKAQIITPGVTPLFWGPGEQS
jgi:hypothetical protein